MHISTGTCGGKITCNFLRDYCMVNEEGEEEEEDDNDDEDPLFIYEEITAFLISSRPQIQPQQQSSENVVIEPKLPLRSSLFYHVSPYIKFQLTRSNDIVFPLELTNCLKWKLTPMTPQIIRKIVTNTGYKLIDDSSDWCGCWSDAMFAFRFKTIKHFQKINHFPGAHEIGHKDRLCRNMRRLVATHGRKLFNFIPDTYIMPEDLPKLRSEWYKGRRNKWIVKPPASSRGQGIHLIRDFIDIPGIVDSSSTMIVQQYLSRPKLIGGSKFDLRLYALVTSFDPLKIYVYREGLVRFACDNYRNSCSNLDNHFMHLTNYSVNRFCSRYECNDTGLESPKGHKWSLSCLWSYLSNQGVDTAEVLKKIHDLIIKTIISCESTINSFTRVYLSSRYSCYELFGFDVLLDENTKPWLLEVNISPSLQTSSALDEAVKGPLIRDTLNIVGYQVPANIPELSLRRFGTNYNELTSSSSICHDFRFYDRQLSKMEKRKQTYFLRACNQSDSYINAILETLTPDDVRHLMPYEDELESMGDFRKIFPTTVTRKYFKYFEKVTYYNLLFDTWEKTYGKNKRRENGIALLRNLSEEKYHLFRPK